jgi:NAD(P)-dependent dehydrogenase (short-subunit alcohol dehydrogenase family)
VTSPFSYTGKSVVVTGAASGVGAELVRVLRELDVADITGLDRNHAKEVDAFIEVDLSDLASIEAAIKLLPDRVDVLFNNAGVAATLPAKVVMGVNYLAPRVLTLSLLDRMSEGSSIVITASTAGGGYAQHLEPILELMEIDDWDAAMAWLDSHDDLLGDPYAFSKECAQVLALWAAPRTMAHGVRINSVCPGVIETPLLKDFKATMTEPVLDWMIAQGNGRRATARDIASVLAFAGSDAGAYVHGTTIIADGGFSGAMATNQVDFSTYPS